MALINCLECNKQISEKVFDCPHCGCPMKKKPKNSLDKLLDLFRFLIITCVLFVFVVFFIAVMANQEELKSEYTTSVSQDEEIVFKKQWRQLKVGLTQKQVKVILGEPLEVEATPIYLTWRYSNGGEVKFPIGDFIDNKGRLESWDEPAWQY